MIPEPDDNDASSGEDMTPKWRRYAWIALWIVCFMAGTGIGVGIRSTRKPDDRYYNYSIRDRVLSCENGVFTSGSNQTLWPAGVQGKCRADATLECCETPLTHECDCNGRGFSGNLNLIPEKPKVPTDTTNTTTGNSTSATDETERQRRRRRRRLNLKAGYLTPLQNPFGATLSFELANSVDEWVALGQYKDFACSVCENDRQSIYLPPTNNTFFSEYFLRLMTNRGRGRTPLGRINVYGGEDGTFNLNFDPSSIDDFDPPLKTGPWFVDTGFISISAFYQKPYQPNVPLTLHHRRFFNEPLDIHDDKKMIDRCTSEYEARKGNSCPASPPA